MGTELRKLLDDAKGTTEHVIAIVLDIRGFTPFCKEIGESLDIANFLKRVYIRIIDEYFPKAAFYKPTGDGLLIVVRYDETSPKDTVASIMEKCLKLVKDFGTLTEGDDRIYFPTPDKIGIGVSRGTACCISSGEEIVDYSGKVLNLASRLNDFARPSGIVFDSSLGLSLLPKEMQGLFLCENVSVRGIAEDKLMPVWFTKQYTIIPSSRKQPLKEPEWFVGSISHSYRKLKEAHASGLDFFSLELINKPLDEKRIVLDIRCEVDERIVGFTLDTTSKGLHYLDEGRKYYLKLEYPVLMEQLGKLRLTDNTIVKFEVRHPVAQKNA